MSAPLSKVTYSRSSFHLSRRLSLSLSLSISLSPFIQAVQIHLVILDIGAISLLTRQSDNLVGYLTLRTRKDGLQSDILDFVIVWQLLKGRVVLL